MRAGVLVLACVGALADEPKTCKDWVDRGNALERARRYAEAADAFAGCVTLEPHHAEALSDMAGAAYQAGQLNRAEVAARAAIEHASSDAIRGASLYNLGRIRAAWERLSTKPQRQPEGERGEQ